MPKGRDVRPWHTKLASACGWAWDIAPLVAGALHIALLLSWQSLPQGYPLLVCFLAVHLSYVVWVLADALETRSNPGYAALALFLGPVGLGIYYWWGRV